MISSIFMFLGAYVTHAVSMILHIFASDIPQESCEAAAKNELDMMSFHDSINDLTTVTKILLRKDKSRIRI